MAENCIGCGWLRQGAYVDGFPYLACGWWGYILHGEGKEVCSDARTPAQVERYLKTYQNKNKKNKT